MSKFRKPDAVIGGCSSKKGLQITQKKHPCWSLPSIKPQALNPAALLKRNYNTDAKNQRNFQEHLPLQNTSDDGSFWRKAKFDFCLKVRWQFPYSKPKTGGITLN